LTRSFKEAVKNRAVRDPEFRIGLLNESIEAFLRGEVVEGKVLLRDYVNATLGFEQLAELTHKSPKSLMRMLGPDGNPRADNLFALIAELQKNEGIALEVRPHR
jgi:DNA-binding phage protein